MTCFGHIYQPPPPSPTSTFHTLTSPLTLTLRFLLLFQMNSVCFVQLFVAVGSVPECGPPNQELIFKEKQPFLYQHPSNARMSSYPPFPLYSGIFVCLELAQLLEMLSSPPCLIVCLMYCFFEVTQHL